MAIYLGKNVVLAFCVDYSASLDGRLVIYEAQHLLSDNFDSPDTRRDKLGRRSASGAQIVASAFAIWKPAFNDIVSRHYIVDFPPPLESDKVLQRKHLFANCPSITPDFFLCDATTSTAEIDAFISKHQGRVVLKGKGGLGSGNQFLREHPQKQHNDLIESYKKTHGSFVLEQEVMYSPLEMNEDQSRGVCYRDIIFYDTETKQLHFFEVYEEILDVMKSVNNHSTSNKISETCFFLTHTPAELKSLMEKNEGKFPAFYAAKRQAFLMLSNQISHYLQTETFPKNVSSSSFLIFFLDKFHRDAKDAYQLYLKSGRFLDTKKLSDQAMTDKLTGNLKPLFSTLTLCFTNKEKSISECKKEALHLIALKLSTLNEQDLWIFQHILLSLRVAPGPSSLREIWHQKNFFSCFCCSNDPYSNTSYGNTTAGNRFVQMISDARLEAKSIPQHAYAPPSTEQLL